MEKVFWILFSISVALGSCGSLRYLTGISVLFSTSAAALSALFTYLLGRRISRGSLMDSKSVALWVILGAVWLSLLLVLIGSKGRTGLYTLNSQDVASHLAFMGGFIYKSGDAYHGFVSLYGLVGAMVRGLNVHIVDALAVSIYSTLAVGLLMIGLATVVALRSGGNRSIEVGVGLLAASAALLLIDIPIIFYKIGEGFWAHITSIIVLAGLWAGYTVVSAPFARISIAVGSIALYRFAYGLNLGDLVATTAILTLIESKHLGRLRFATMGGAAALLLTSILCYQKLLPLGEMNGGIIPIDIQGSLFYSAILLFGIVGALFIARTSGRSSESIRFLLFPVLFCSVSMLAEFGYHQAGLPERYYSYKYGVHRVILLSFAGAVAFTSIAFNVVRNVRTSRITVLLSTTLAGIVLAGSAGLYGTYKHYGLGLGPFLVSPRKSFPDPLFSDQLAGTIQTVLAREGKSYHGTLARTWGGIMFLNGFMLHKEHGEGTKEIAENMTMQGLPPPPPNSCVFWIRSGLFRTQPPVPLPELDRSINSFQARSDKVCIRKKDHVGKTYALCYVCGQAA